MADAPSLSRPRKTGRDRRGNDRSLVPLPRRATVYAYALDWHRLGLLALAGAAAAKYIDPVLLAAVLPAAAKQVLQNLAQGRVFVDLANRQLAQLAERTQCSGGVYSGESAPERCAYEEGHEGDCEA